MQGLTRFWHVGLVLGAAIFMTACGGANAGADSKCAESALRCPPEGNDYAHADPSDIRDCHMEQGGSGPPCCRCILRTKNAQ